jgi:hypothetical protein
MAPTLSFRRPRTGLVGALLLLALASLALGWCAPPPGTAILTAQDKQPALPQRLVRVSPAEALSAVEVSVAINPTNPDHLVAVAQQRTPKSPTTNAGYASTDGGRTWKFSPTANPHNRVQGDDAVTFTADGLAVRTYISFLGIREARPKRASTGIIISTSKDGLTWGAPVPVVDHVNSCEPFEDKPWVKADTLSDSKFRGNIYVAWSKFDVYGSKKPEHKTHVYFSRSRDGGKTFAVPHRISEAPGDCLDDSTTLMGAVPAVGVKGEVHVVWAGPKGLVLTTSTDGGARFGKNQVITETAGWNFPVKGLDDDRANGLPSMAVDLSKGKDRGSIYVAWGDRRNGDPDVFVIASRDGGATWSKPLRVNDDPRGKDQFFPWLAVDPVDGSVNIAFYDRRGQEGTRTAVTLARSVDGGRTFVNHKINHDFLCEREAGFFGDYLGIDAHGGRVAVLYMHTYGKRQLGLSGAIFDFMPGTQEARPEKKDG